MRFQLLVEHLIQSFHFLSPRKLDILFLVSQKLSLLIVDLNILLMPRDLQFFISQEFLNDVVPLLQLRQSTEVL